MVGSWWLVIGSGRRLAVGRRWRLAAVGGWRLVAVGGSWWLAVDGPRGQSSRAVLSQQKSGFLKDRPGGRYHSEGRMQSHRRMPYTCICRDKGLLFDPPPPAAAVPLHPSTHPHHKFTKRGRKCEASLRHRPQTPPPGTTVRLLVVVRDPEQSPRHICWVESILSFVPLLLSPIALPPPTPRPMQRHHQRHNDGFTG